MLNLSLLADYGSYFKDEEGVKHYDYSDVWTAFAKDSLSNVLLYAAIALVALLLAIGLFVRWKKPEALKSYLRVAATLAIGFAGAVIVTMLALEFLDMKESGAVFDLVLIPTCVLGGCVVLGAAAIYVSTFFGKKTAKITAITALSVAGAALVALLVCLGVYLASGAGEKNNDVTITLTENILLYVCAAALCALLVFIALFFGRKEHGFDTKSISYGAVCIALSFALSYLTVFRLPQGGSVTIASLLPLMIYSYMFGVKKGIFAGMIYGLLQAVQDPRIIHPAQFLLDYPIAFAGIGAAGLFARFQKLEKLPQVQFLLGGIVAGILRYLAHILSGVFAFSEYAFHWATGEAMNPWLYSLAYNSFVFADIALAIVIGVIIFSSPAFVKAARKYQPKKKAPEEASEEVSEESTPEA